MILSEVDPRLEQLSTFTRDESVDCMFCAQVVLDAGFDEKCLHRSIALAADVEGE